MNNQEKSKENTVFVKEGSFKAFVNKNCFVDNGRDRDGYIPDHYPGKQTMLCLRGKLDPGAIVHIEILDRLKNTGADVKVEYVYHVSEYDDINNILTLVDNTSEVINPATTTLY